jgi:hypothetical protein
LERRRWELEGRTEAAIKLGGKWVSLLGVLGPQAQLMTLGASMRKLLEEDPEAGLAALAGNQIAGMLRATGDSPMAQGISTLADLGKNIASTDESVRSRALERGAQTFITGWVPQIVQQAARATDVNEEGMVRMRQVLEPGDPLATARNAIMQGIPGVREQLPVRRNALGQERATSVGGFGVLSPARLTMETSDPRAQELWRTGAAVPRTSKRKGESQDLFERRQQALGTAVGRAVEAVTNNPAYQNIETMDTQALRAALANLARTGEVQEKQVRQMEKMDDAALRTRLQGVVLERAISRAREAAGRQFPDPSRRGGALLNALTR